MCPLAQTAREGIGDEYRIEEWVGLSVYRMMEQAISYTGLVYIARFGIVNLEGFVATVGIGKVFEIMIESVVTASFLQKEQKLPHVTKSIVKLDTLKFFLMTLWETRGLDTGKYTAVSEPLSEVGKMLGGWRNQLIKQNSDVPSR